MSEIPVINRNSTLRESEFSAIVESIDQIITIIDPESLNIKYINKILAPLTQDQVIGKNISDFTSPEQAAIIHKHVEEVKRTRTPITYETEATSARRANGKVWYRTTLSVILDENNSIESLLVLLSDISDIKEKEIENINTGERIKAIINNTSDIICSINLDYNILEFNSTFAQMVKLGYNMELEKGMPVLHFIDPNRHEHLKAIYHRVQQGESCVDISSFYTINANVVYNETNYNPIYNSEKKISGISIFSKDITERVKSEQKIINALKEKEVLLAEIHHRIKNNLAMVSSLLELQEMNITNAEAKEALAISRKRIKSTALIHELLYRNESFQNINLHEYLRELFGHLKINDNVLLDISGDEVILNLTTAMPLGLMLNEIMLNSFKHSHNDGLEGRTEIITKIDSKKLTIDYCDCNGSFPEHIDFKNSQTTGLTLIHTFAEQLNGSIELTSRTPPRYRIEIPLDENR